MLDALGDALQKLSTADPAVAKSVVAGHSGTACGLPASAEPCAAPNAVPEVPPPATVVPVSASAVTATVLSTLATPSAAPLVIPQAVVPVVSALPTAACSTSAEPSCERSAPAIQFAPAAVAVETSIATETPNVPVAAAETTNAAPVASAPETRTIGSSPSQVTRLQLLTAAIREHRHMVAALVIGVCGMTLWKDTHSTPKDVLASGDDPAASVDAFLDDFEAADRASLGDPAEPASADPVSDAPLLIPSTLTTTDPEGTEGSGRASANSVSASYPDQDPFPANTSGSVESQPTPKVRPLRFTGRIQPAR